MAETTETHAKKHDKKNLDFTRISRMRCFQEKHDVIHLPFVLVLSSRFTSKRKLRKFSWKIKVALALFELC